MLFLFIFHLVTSGIRGVFKTTVQGWRCSALVDYSPSTPTALNNPSTEGKFAFTARTVWEFSSLGRATSDEHRI